MYVHAPINYQIIPTTLVSQIEVVCILFNTAILTSSINFVFMLVTFCFPWGKLIWRSQPAQQLCQTARIGESINFDPQPLTYFVLQPLNVHNLLSIFISRMVPVAINHYNFDVSSTYVCMYACTICLHMCTRGTYDIYTASHRHRGGSS